MKLAIFRGQFISVFHVKQNKSTDYQDERSIIFMLQGFSQRLSSQQRETKINIYFSYI